MAKVRFAQFEHDLKRVSDLVGLGQALGAMTHGVVDASDLYRAAIAQAVSALDHYVHGVVLDAAVDVLVGRRPSVVQSSRLGLPFHAVESILSAPSLAEREIAARTHVAQRLSLETFQNADNIANALAMIGVPKIWSTAFPADPASVKTELNLVVGRRNRIVHQCDSDPLTPGSVTPLDAPAALDAIATIEKVATGIDKHC